jgi:hypothetical protein
LVAFVLVIQDVDVAARAIADKAAAVGAASRRLTSKILDDTATLLGLVGE